MSPTLGRTGPTVGTSRDRLAVGVLASGRGSNLQALLDACAAPDFPARVVVVISDREHAPALERARAAPVEAVWVNPKDFTSRESFDLTLVRELEKRQVGLVCHAGFMRILSPAYVHAFAGRALNIHPSLLPAFPGIDAIRQAWAHGARVTGCTVHLVDESLDAGPIIAQSAVEVRDEDTLESLEARIHDAEHRLYPWAVRRVLSERWRREGRRLSFEPAPLGRSA